METEPYSGSYGEAGGDDAALRLEDLQSEGGRVSRGVITPQWLMDRLSTPFSSAALASALATETLSVETRNGDEDEEIGIVALLRSWQSLPTDNPFVNIIKARLLMALFAPPPLSPHVDEYIQTIVQTALRENAATDPIDEGIDGSFVSLLLDGIQPLLDAKHSAFHQKLSDIMQHAPPWHVIAAVLLAKYNPAVLPQPDEFSAEVIASVMSLFNNICVLLSQIIIENNSDAPLDLGLSDLPLEARYLPLNACLRPEAVLHIPYEHTPGRHFATDNALAVADDTDGVLQRVVDALDRSHAAHLAALEATDEVAAQHSMQMAESAASESIQSVLSYLSAALPSQPSFVHAARSTSANMTFRPKIGVMSEATAKIMAKGLSYKRQRAEVSVVDMAGSADAEVSGMPPSAKRPAIGSAADDTPMPISRPDTPPHNG